MRCALQGLRRYCFCCFSFFPPVCWLLGRGKGLVVLLIVFVLLGPFGRTVLAHGNEIWQEYSYLGGMDGIALGCLTALIVSRNRFSPSVVRALGIAGATVVFF